MCGLCGEITFDGTPADATAVDRMVECLVPRGPDGQGSWSSGRVAFGHRRLSVIDLSPAGAQPMVDNELGLTAAFNGCIYDYQELRAELEGHGYRFFSTSDTEVILKGYAHWGTDVVSHLHGMFAFVDPRARHRPGGHGPRPAGDQAALPRRDAEAAAVRLHACPRCCGPAASTPPSTRSRCTTTSPGTPSSRRRARC